MYIEAIHDSAGYIQSCYCADTLPAQGGVFFSLNGELPQGHEQARINIDTLTAMEIENSSGLKAAIDPASGEPRVIRVERSNYVMGNFVVDTSAEIAKPPGLGLPEWMKVRTLKRKP